jgi:arylsulfatase A-like enzyme
MAAQARPAAHGQTTSRPNVIFLISDDQGYGDAGCYGAPDAKTPHLNRLAASGARLTSFYANAPMCSPTRASLLTGRYPYRCGVPSIVNSAPGTIGLKEREITLAEALKQQGYRTGLLGKWHLGSHAQSLPNSQGFDEFYGFHSGCVDYYSHRFYWGLGAGLPDFHDLWRNQQEIFQEGEYITHLITREAKRFVRNNSNQPFFLMVSYNAPHYPMHAPRRYVERFQGLERERRMHLAMVAALDDAIGEIVAALDEAGLRDNTLLFFQSDNGATIEDRAGRGGRNTPLRGFKFSLFEGGIRVPAVVSWPGRIPAGQVIDEMAASMDLFPTVAAICEARIPADRTIDGKDISGLLTQGARSPHEALFWKQDDQVAVRRGEWKLVVNGILALGDKHRLRGNDRIFLSNLTKDIGETRNLSIRYPEMTAELRQLCRRWELGLESD